MEMIRQKLKQQKEKIQDEKLNSVQKNFIVHIFITGLQLKTLKSLRKCLMWPRFRKGFYQIGWKPGNMILDLETTFLCICLDSGIFISLDSGILTILT